MESVNTTNGLQPQRDAVQVAEHLLADAEVAMDQAREMMEEATHRLFLSSGVVHGGTRYGAWLPSDPDREHLLATAVQTQDAYRVAVQSWEAARDKVSSAVRKYRRERQEKWVASHQPTLVMHLNHWQERLRRAPSDLAHAEAKKNLAHARFQYETAVGNAPYTD
jgi:hypothetical protein